MRLRRSAALVAMAGAMIAVSATPAIAEPGGGYTGAGSLGGLAPGAEFGAGSLAPSGEGPANCVPLGTAMLAPGSPANPSRDGFENFPVADQSALPERVDLRTSTTTFNRLWEFTLVDGALFTRPRAEATQWRQVPLPHCMNGILTEISVDDDEMIAIDANGWLYTMDNALHAPWMWNWTSSFGAPLWLDRGQRMPGDHRDWATSVHSPQEQRVFTDTGGFHQFVGSAKCTMIMVLAGEGNRIVYLDPWLPNDHSYEIGTPMGGRFKAESLSAAASTTFVMNKYGDMYTRLFDFDISGADTVFFDYSWDDQTGKKSPENPAHGLYDPSVAKFQLPAPSWERQPKVPGEITSQISVEPTGEGSDARLLKVEGRKDGQNGFWHKMIRDDAWSFTATGGQLSTGLIENSPRDRSSETLAAPSGVHYSVALPDRGAAQGYRLEVSDFEWATSQREATVVAPDGSRFAVDLHTIDNLRMTPRGPGLDEHPRTMLGAIGLSDQVWAQRSDKPAIGVFVDGWLDGAQIAPVRVNVSESAMAIERSRR